MCDKTLALISSIEKYPCIYNHNLRDYCSKDITERAWSEIAEQLSLSVAECRDKWRNLRLSMLRSLKPNTDGSLRKKYYLHKEMEFLLPFIRQKMTGALEDDEDSTNYVNHEATSPQQPFEYEFINTEPNAKRKKEKIETVFDRDNSRKAFLIGLLPEINALSDKQMKMFRRKVLALLDDITGYPVNMEVQTPIENYRELKSETINDDEDAT